MLYVVILIKVKNFGCSKSSGQFNIYKYWQPFYWRPLHRHILMYLKILSVTDYIAPLFMNASVQESFDLLTEAFSKILLPFVDFVSGDKCDYNFPPHGNRNADIFSRLME